MANALVNGVRLHYETRGTGLPRVQVETVEDTGHVPHETHPDLNANVVNRFIAAHTSSPTATIPPCPSWLR